MLPIEFVTCTNVQSFRHNFLLVGFTGTVALVIQKNKHEGKWYPSRSQISASENKKQRYKRAFPYFEVNKKTLFVLLRIDTFCGKGAKPIEFTSISWNFRHAFNSCSLELLCIYLIVLHIRPFPHQSSTHVCLFAIPLFKKTTNVFLRHVFSTTRSSTVQREE